MVKICELLLSERSETDCMRTETEETEQSDTTTTIVATRTSPAEAV